MVVTIFYVVCEYEKKQQAVQLFGVWTQDDYNCSFTRTGKLGQTTLYVTGILCVKLLGIT